LPTTKGKKVDVVTTNGISNTAKTITRTANARIATLSFSDDGDLDPLINSGFKVLIAMILIFIWVFALLKIKNWIFRKIVKP